MSPYARTDLVLGYDCAVTWFEKLTTRATQAMHQGVVRDMEQQKIKRERQLDFDTQRALEMEYKKDQSVRDSTLDVDDTASGKKGGGTR